MIRTASATREEQKDRTEPRTAILNLTQQKLPYPGSQLGNPVPERTAMPLCHVDDSSYPR
eukprot:510801-Hanusia_phi.AAC.1